MMRKYILPIMNILFPYTVVSILVFTFNMGGVTEKMESIGGYNPYVHYFWLVIWFLFVLAFNIAYMCDMLINHHSVTEWLKRYMLIKCIQIPAYIVIFLFGALCVLTVFTIPFSFLLWIFDCMGVFLTGLLAIAGVVRTYKENKLKKSTAICCGIGSFLFCVDVVIAIALYRNVKKQEIN